MARYEDQISALTRAGPSGHAASEPSSLAALRSLAERHNERTLSMLIESEIIPRLLVAHSTDTQRVSPGAVTALDDPTIAAEDIEALVPLALQVEADALLAHVEGVLARGASAIP